MRIVVLVLTPFAVLLGSATPSPDDLLTWVAEPMEVRVACPEPFDPVQVNHLVGRPITFEPPGLDPAALRIAAARLDDDGRTLILATDPHPRDTSYGLPEPRLGDPWIYAPRGVEVTWTEAEAAESTWSSWWPVLDSDASRTATVEHSPSHRRTFERLAHVGRLQLATLASLPEGPATIRLEADAPFEATVNYAPVEIVRTGATYHAESAFEATTEPVELSLTIQTGRDGKAPTLRALARREGEPEFRPIAPDRLTLPWVPPTLPGSAEVPAPPYDLTGGDPKRGEAVFFGDEAKCSACHRIGDRGGNIGPDLSNLDRGDPARIYRDIAEPSAVIHPQFQPYSVALTDGRVLAGVVRAEGAEKVRISDISAQDTIVDRGEVAELRPSTTSIMPVGLAGALGEDRMRDLIAFLTDATALGPRPEKLEKR